MRVTSTGQITIPPEVRKLLGITPGSEVEFECDGQSARLVAAGRRHVPPPGGPRRGPAKVAMTTDEITSLTDCHD